MKTGALCGGADLPARAAEGLRQRGQKGTGSISRCKSRGTKATFWARGLKWDSSTVALVPKATGYIRVHAENIILFSVVCRGGLQIV